MYCSKRCAGILTTQDTVRTARLRFRGWRPDDAEQLLPVLEANRAHLGAWLPPRVAEPVPLPDLRRRLELFGAELSGRREWRFGLFTPDGARILGEVCMFPRDATSRVELEASDRVELGYWIRADESGQGLVTEAVRGAVECARHREPVPWHVYYRWMRLARQTPPDVAVSFATLQRESPS